MIIEGPNYGHLAGVLNRHIYEPAIFPAGGVAWVTSRGCQSQDAAHDDSPPSHATTPRSALYRDAYGMTCEEHRFNLS